ncbi:MAG: tRNA preQ1(34) S-adenosylmethionine ribosyltransferase-isomerase QueA [Pseudomonadota bacterium]
MRVDLFDFDLPEERIALEPARPRDSARMLLVRNDGLRDAGVSDLPGLLSPGDALVLNDTKVIPARLNAVRPSRGAEGADVKIEVLLLVREAPDSWRVAARPAKRLRPGDLLIFSEALSGEVIEALGGGEVLVRFDRAGEALDAAIAGAGAPPLPPYISRRRGAAEQDTDDYQTVYAKQEGSIAAPTAGLHFTERLLNAVRARGVSIVELTLHVGAGTFRPVSVDDTKDHRMHAEWANFSEDAAQELNAARAAGGRIVAAGTTSLRTLETAVRPDGMFEPFRGETDIFITPGYPFRAADRLLTNFHLPRSTLFMLVSAFSGLDVMKRAYGHAIAEGYRFYSYGDACLLDRSDGADL